MQNRYRKSYWMAQFLGWTLYAFLSLFSSYVENRFSVPVLAVVAGAALAGMLFTHLLRYLISAYWVGRKIIPLKGKWLLALVPVLAVAQASVQMLLQETLIVDFKLTAVHFTDFFYATVNWLMIFYIWLALYLLYRYMEQGRQAQMQELRLMALQQENELNQLKAQLNPHFLFNAMNSIRALISENPALAREGITRLSEMLRSTFIYGKRNTITLAEEITLVNDYLSLEKLRYEERLVTTLRVDKHCEPLLIPPFIIQTLVENAIKHGIGKLEAGGTVSVEVIQTAGSGMLIRVTNSGSLQPKSQTTTGVGWENTRKRVALLYGSYARFDTREEPGCVVCELLLPQAPQTVPEG